LSNSSAIWRRDFIVLRYSDKNADINIQSTAFHDNRWSIGIPSPKLLHKIYCNWLVALSPSLLGKGLGVRFSFWRRGWGYSKGIQLIAGAERLWFSQSRADFAIQKKLTVKNATLKQRGQADGKFKRFSLRSSRAWRFVFWLW
jgi:hypothetical protein